MQAIILKKQTFSEGNEIITMYSRELGKVRGIARAAKKPQSKLAFGLQELFHSEIELARSKTSQRQSFAITGAKPLETFKNIREQQQAVSRALYATELILKSTADEQSNPELFDHFLEFLRHLQNSSQKGFEHSCVSIFTIGILALTGYELNFDGCVVCGRSLEGAQSIYFSNRKGGFLDQACAAKSPDSKMLSTDVFNLLKSHSGAGLENIDLLEQAATFEHFDNAVKESKLPGREFIDLSKSFAEHVLERDLKSGRFLV